MTRPSFQPFATTLPLAIVLSLLLPLFALAQPADYAPDVSYTLTTGLADGKMAFIGIGGTIDGVVNPALGAEPGDVVQITLINGDGVQHDWALDGLGAKTDLVNERGASSVTVFRVDEAGEYTYFCTVPGHRQAGMEGLLRVGEAVAADSEAMASVVRDPTDLPAPIGVREAVTHDITLRAEELEARLADGTSYRFWTFNGEIPGPFLRVRVGDTVNLTFEN
ncbi:MAG: multicopper oxidase domain-containing protein, partial [Acidimicrobiia bacterium]|nr:multicopper oxidase domain-containing protein [Acidimicrobiia bacterium]